MFAWKSPTNDPLAEPGSDHDSRCEAVVGRRAAQPAAMDASLRRAGGAVAAGLSSRHPVDVVGPGLCRTAALLHPRGPQNTRFTERFGHSVPLLLASASEAGRCDRTLGRTSPPPRAATGVSSGSG
jgi:hypothetical protein